MYLSKALKTKKKLVSKVNRAFDRFKNYNSHEVETPPTYDPEESYKEWKKLSTELVSLKTKIIQATMPIYHKIFDIAEAKNQISLLNQIDVTSGLVKNMYRSEDEGTTYKAYIDELGRDKEIERLEDYIETLQSEIEAFNSTTQI